MKKLRLSTLFSQRDSRWKDVMLGYNAQGSIYTIGSFGCLITTVDVYLQALGININVLELNEKLKQNNGYTPGSGLYIFDSLKSIWPDIKMDYVSQKWDGPVSDEGIQKIKDLIDQGKYVVTEVDFYPNTANEDMHWVGIYGYTDTGEFMIFDPWTGTLVPLSVYGDAKRVIYCYRTYSKPLPFDNVEPVVCHPASTNDKLIHGCSAWEDTVRYLEVGTDPKDTSSETVRSVIAGIRSRATDLSNRLDQATAEVKNREEQVSRLKNQLLEEEKLRREATDALNKALTANKDVSKVYEGQLAAKQELIEEYARSKGALTIENTNLKTQLAKAREDAVKNMSNSDIFSILIARIAPWIKDILDSIPSK